MNINDKELELLNSEEATNEEISLYEMIHNTLEKYYNNYSYNVYFDIIKPSNQRKLYNDIKSMFNYTDAEATKAIKIFERENKKYYKYYKQIYKNKFELKKTKFKILKILMG